MEQNTTNEVIGQVVEETMAKSNNSGKGAGIFLIGAGVGVITFKLIEKITAKIRNKKAVVIEQQTSDDAKEENSDKE